MDNIQGIPDVETEDWVILLFETKRRLHSVIDVFDGICQGHSHSFKILLHIKELFGR